MSLRTHSIHLILAVLAVGCVGAPVAAPADSSLLETGLPLIEDVAVGEDWTAARPGCEGQLGGGVSLAIASVEFGLVAALDGYGHIVCVDTVEAISEELEDNGRQEDAETLAARFEATAMANDTRTFTPRAYMGDPHPEPNDCDSCGDPHPEPN